MPSRFILTSNGLNIFEERGVQKSVFQDYFKGYHRAGSGNWAKMKIMREAKNDV